MQRLDYLDGLRGLAAMQVVFEHVVLGFRPGIFDAWPRILWDGNVAVFLFFLMSGFVLTGSFERAPAAVGGALFGPVVGAVAGQVGTGPAFSAAAVIGAALIGADFVIPAPHRAERFELVQESPHRRLGKMCASAEPRKRQWTSARSDSAKHRKSPRHCGTGIVFSHHRDKHTRKWNISGHWQQFGLTQLKKKSGTATTSARSLGVSIGRGRGFSRGQGCHVSALVA